MATAKRNPTDTQVQGHRPTKDPLDKLVAIAIRVAQREGLLNQDSTTYGEGNGQVERSGGNRRST